MNAPKVYSTNSVVMLPSAWHDLVGTGHPHPQGTVAVVAATKADAERTLAVVSNTVTAAAITRSLRVVAASGPDSVARLIAAGVIDPARPGRVYAWRDGVKGDPIMEVSEFIPPIVVAHFRYDTAKGGLWVEVAR